MQQWGGINIINYYLPVPWIYPAEVSTQRMRISGAGVATATNWICNYVVVLVTPIAVQNMSWRYYIIYAVLNLSFAPIVKFFVSLFPFPANWRSSARLTLLTI